MKPVTVTNASKMSGIEHFPHAVQSHHVAMKTKELTLKEMLSVSCPTCGAAIAEPCELHSGARRTEPHRDRKLCAAEAVEMETSSR